MSAEPVPQTLENSFDRNRFGGLFAGSHLYGSVVVSTGGRHILVRMDESDIEVPHGSALLDHVLDRVRVGGRVYLTREGQRVAGVVPADVAESIDPEEGEQPTPDRRRTLDELRWEQGIEPVEDPAELQGEVLDELDFAEFYTGVMSSRVG